MQMTVAQVLVRYLKEQGVHHVFGVSGHSIFDITDAIYLEPDIYDASRAPAAEVAES